MKLPIVLEINSEEETKALADEFSKIVKLGDVVALNGNLGSGKTFFVKKVAGNFKINNVSSPTFAIVNNYSGTKKITHIDFYRINKLNELYDIGIEEYLSDEESIVFIEWANQFEELIPVKHYQIIFKILNNGSREISIKKYE